MDVRLQLHNNRKGMTIIMLDDLWQFCKAHPGWAVTFFLGGYLLGSSLKYSFAQYAQI